MHTSCNKEAKLNLIKNALLSTVQSCYFFIKYMKKDKKSIFDRDRTRTCNPQIRSLMPYPLGHTTLT